MNNDFATARRLARDLWADRREDISDALDVKWYVAEHAATHGYSEWLAGEVYLELMEKLEKR